MRLILKVLVFIGLVLPCTETTGQNVNIEYSSYAMFDSSEQPVGGYDDGKEFVRAKDLLQSALKVFSPNLRLRGRLDLKKRKFTITISGNFRERYEFSMEKATKNSYIFSGTGIIDGITVVLDKRLLSAAIIIRKMDKDGQFYIFTMLYK